MVDRVEFRVTGLRELRRAIRQVDSERKWGKELGRANQAAAFIVADEAARRAPRRTGRLAKSIKASRSQASASIKAGSNTRVPYAFPINFGWPSRGIEAQEFMYSAVAAKSDEFLERYEQEIDALLGRIFR